MRLGVIEDPHPGQRHHYRNDAEVATADGGSALSCWPGFENLWHLPNLISAADSQRLLPQFHRSGPHSGPLSQECRNRLSGRKWIQSNQL